MSENVIDKEALQRLLDVIGGDQEDLDELIEDFEDVGPATLKTMQGAAQSGDMEALRIAAHSMKSNGSDFGATELAKACEALEHACKNGSVDGADAQVANISDLLDQARGALKSVSLP